MNTMESVRKFLRTYEPLANNKLNVDFLPAEESSYSVEAIPTNEVVRTYTDGSTYRQFLCVLCSREAYGSEILQQLENLAFFEDFSEWLREQSLIGNFPDLGEGRSVVSFVASTTGYAMATSETKARYQIQLKMEFIQKRT
ncbi:chloramphenicol resistance protein [Chakrabartyella piscis]|uniref:chloramphenicol resistance protein n=1 Tax=Chakrabartyella piscis TaxID=2918914 RepID=UPI00295853FD|nr:chloramphenicol resistance protein [Chakrabartyella piscis]